MRKNNKAKTLLSAKNSEYTEIIKKDICILDTQINVMMIQLNDIKNISINDLYQLRAQLTDLIRYKHDLLNKIYG